MQDLDVTQWRIDELKITKKIKNKRIENEGVHRLASQVNEGMAVKLMEDLHTSTHETHDIQLRERETCWNRKKKILLLLLSPSNFIIIQPIEQLDSVISVSFN